MTGFFVLLILFKLVDINKIHIPKCTKSFPPILGGAGVVNFTSDFGIFIFVLLLIYQEFYHFIF